MPLDLGMIVTEIITGGKNKIFQEAIRESTGNQWRMRTSLCLLFSPLLCVSVLHSPSLEKADAFISCFPSFYISNSHATYNLLFFVFPHTIIFPGLFPSSE